MREAVRLLEAVSSHGDSSDNPRQITIDGELIEDEIDISEAEISVLIQRVLDHGSIEMTALYAHLDDETVKREMDSFHDRVNVRGERIALPVDGPLGEAVGSEAGSEEGSSRVGSGSCARAAGARERRARESSMGNLDRGLDERHGP